MADQSQAESSASGDASPPGTVDGVDIKQLQRLFALLRDKLPSVMTANRFFEERTGYHNEAGANNLVDALSHIATMVDNAESLGAEGQAEQIAHLEDHLRRSMMEGFERVLKYRLGEIEELWEVYGWFVRPRVRDKEIPGVVPLPELEAKRDLIRECMEKGRSSKVKTSWDDWQNGTEALTTACDTAEGLMDDLRVSLATIDQLYGFPTERRWPTLAITSLVIGAIGFVLALLSLTGIL
jgi:hypothetical protein